MENHLCQSWQGQRLAFAILCKYFPRPVNEMKQNSNYSLNWELWFSFLPEFKRHKNSQSWTVPENSLQFGCQVAVIKPWSVFVVLLFLKNNRLHSVIVTKKKTALVHHRLWPHLTFHWLAIFSLHQIFNKIFNENSSYCPIIFDKGGPTLLFDQPTPPLSPLTPSYKENSASCVV